MIEREFQVLKVLEGTGFPASRALALCEYEARTPRPFISWPLSTGASFWDPALAGLKRRDRASGA